MLTPALPLKNAKISRAASTALEVRTFIQIQDSSPTLVKCPPIGTFDLALLLDTNVDIGDAGLAATKSFAKEMIDSFEVGASSAKVKNNTCISFSSSLR